VKYAKKRAALRIKHAEVPFYGRGVFRFSGLRPRRVVQDGDDVVAFYDQVFFTVDFDGGAGILVVDDAVPHLHLDFFLVVTHGDDLGFLSFFLGRVRNDDAAGCFGFRGCALHEHPVV
jgi:hypothetical protein